MCIAKLIKLCDIANWDTIFMRCKYEVGIHGFAGDGIHKFHESEHF